MSTDPEFKIPVFYKKGSGRTGPVRTFWPVPVYVERELWDVLDGVLHPETIEPGYEDLGPKDARQLLHSVLISIHINWEDIPNPGSTPTQNN
jgi:hypothetical protein